MCTHVLADVYGPSCAEYEQAGKRVVSCEWLSSVLQQQVRVGRWRQSAQPRCTRGTHRRRHVCCAGRGAHVAPHSPAAQANTGTWSAQSYHQCHWLSRCGPSGAEMDDSTDGDVVRDPAPPHGSRAHGTQSGVYASYTHWLKPTNTHLVACTMDSEKYRRACEWRMRVVNYKWVIDAFDKWQLQPEASYACVIELPQDASLRNSLPGSASALADASAHARDMHAIVPPTGLAIGKEADTDDAAHRIEHPTDPSVPAVVAATGDAHTNGTCTEPPAEPAPSSAAAAASEQAPLACSEPGARGSDAPGQAIDVGDAGVLSGSQKRHPSVDVDDPSHTAAPTRPIDDAATPATASSTAVAATTRCDADDAPVVRVAPSDASTSVAHVSTAGRHKRRALLQRPDVESTPTVVTAQLVADTAFMHGLRERRKPPSPSSGVHGPAVPQSEPRTTGSTASSTPPARVAGAPAVAVPAVRAGRKAAATATVPAQTVTPSSPKSEPITRAALAPSARELELIVNIGATAPTVAPLVGTGATSRSPSRATQRAVAHETSATTENTARPCVMLTKGISGDERARLERVVRQLGGITSQVPEMCTHLIAVRIVRTIKFLVAISMGRHIVSPVWLAACRQAGRFVPAEPYTLLDADGEVRHAQSARSASYRVATLSCMLHRVARQADIGAGFRLADAIARARARRQKLLAGMQIYITSHVAEASAIRQLCLCAGAEAAVCVVDSHEVRARRRGAADDATRHGLCVGARMRQVPSRAGFLTDCRSGKAVVVSCTADLPLIASLRSTGVPVHTSEFLIISILRQELLYGAHLLDDG